MSEFVGFDIDGDVVGNLLRRNLHGSEQALVYTQERVKEAQERVRQFTEEAEQQERFVAALRKELRMRALKEESWKTML